MKLEKKSPIRIIDCEVNFAVTCMCIPLRSPIAVGTAAMSGSDMFDSAMRGKGVHVLHMVGDELWYVIVARYCSVYSHHVKQFNNVYSNTKSLIYPFVY